MTPDHDRLAAALPADAQRQAAHVAQDAFSTAFRLSVDGDLPGRDAALAEVDEARTLRRVLLASGLDQWGLAYSQAFELAAIPALSALLGSLRTSLDGADDARFQRLYAGLDKVETDPIEFKIELRRNIHLALWHAMTACDDRVEAQVITRAGEHDAGADPAHAAARVAAAGRCTVQHPDPPAGQ